MIDTDLAGRVLRPWNPEDKPSLLRHANNCNVWRNMTDMCNVCAGSPPRVRIESFQMLPGQADGLRTSGFRTPLFIATPARPEGRTTASCIAASSGSGASAIPALSLGFPWMRPGSRLFRIGH